MITAFAPISTPPLRDFYLHYTTNCVTASRNEACKKTTSNCLSFNTYSKELDKCCKAHKGLWNAEAEKMILKHFNVEI